MPLRSRHTPSASHFYSPIFERNTVPRDSPPPTRVVFSPSQLQSIMSGHHASPFAPAGPTPPPPTQRDFAHYDNPIEMRGFTDSHTSLAYLEIFYRPAGVMFRQTNPLSASIASRRETLHAPGNHNLRTYFTLNPLTNAPAPVTGTASITREWVARPTGGPPSLRFVLRYTFSARMSLPQGGFTADTVACSGQLALP